ncbi:Mur ligase domain-containing protein, partial [Acidobacterium sp. S8]|uniref:Mur ligase domain-containing protein n=1 Tax=Acidobacterium sp. S8 TaxID=1641854 RepID=UPI0020B10C41
MRRAGPLADVTGVEYDSRKVAQGSLFVAMQGGTADGNRFILSAIERGAHAVVTDSAMAFQEIAAGSPDIAVAEVAHGRRALAEISANYF